MHSGEIGITRRIKISGLKNAVIRVFPDDNIDEANIHFYLNGAYPWREKKLSFKKGEEKFGHCYKVENVTGEVAVSW